jgi:hypothetical protein
MKKKKQRLEKKKQKESKKKHTGLFSTGFIEKDEVDRIIDETTLLR